MLWYGCASNSVEGVICSCRVVAVISGRDRWWILTMFWGLGPPELLLSSFSVIMWFSFEWGLVLVCGFREREQFPKSSRSL